MDHAERHREDLEERRAQYVLARLGARRSVRAALAAAALRRGGPALARQIWRSGPAGLDDPGPASSPTGRYAHLRVAHLSDHPISHGSAPSIRLHADTWRADLNRERPDLVIVDASPAWLSPALLTELVGVARQRDARVVAIDAGARLARTGACSVDLLVTTADEPTADLSMQPWVDTRTTNPVGVPCHPAGTIDADETTPSVIVREHAAAVAAAASDHPATLGRLLAWLAAGGVVVAPDSSRAAAALGPVAHDLLGSPDQLQQRAASLARDEGERERVAVRARRHVLTQHSALHRFEELVEALDLGVRPPPMITVLLATRRPEFVQSAVAAVSAQMHPAIELQLMLHGIDTLSPDLPDRPGMRIHTHRVPANLPLGAVLNIGLDAATGELIAKMDDDDLYGSRHLPDALLALTYSGADVTGRWANVVYLEDSDVTIHTNLEHQERWAHHLPGATMLIRSDVLRRLRWRPVPRGVDTELVRSVHAEGGSCYAGHRFGFIRRRHGDHTYLQADRDFRGSGRLLLPGLDRTALEV